MKAGETTNGPRALARGPFALLVFRLAPYGVVVAVIEVFVYASKPNIRM